MVSRIRPTVSMNYNSRPSKDDFEFNVISRHPDYNGKTLQKHFFEGIDNIGVFEESFEIHLKNYSNENVSAKISLDGINVLDGKPANLDPNKEAMWFVRAGATLHLKAWHENANGGSRFVFTHGDKSVALHTSGDVSHKGIIAAAIFIETETPYSYFGSAIGPVFLNSSNNTFGSSISSLRSRSTASYSSNETKSTASDIGEGACASNATMDCLDINLKREASVGAGEYVEQRTHTVQGLTKPKLGAVLRLRYHWYDDLVAKVRSLNVNRFAEQIENVNHPSGFPAEKERAFADLRNVPKVESNVPRTL